MKAILLEASPGSRRLDPSQSSPRSLIPVIAGESSSLQWIISALKANGITDCLYVGGYHIEKVIKRFPDLSFRYIKGSISKDDLDSLINFSPFEDCLVINATTVVMPEAISLMRATRRGTGVYETESGPKMSGIYHVNQTDLETLAKNITYPLETLTAFEDKINNLCQNKVVLNNLAAPAFDLQNVAKMILSGKAQTLESLAPLLKNAQVLDMARFTVEQWQIQKENLITNIQQQFCNTKVVIRSSAISEDGFNASSAGHFLSILNIDTQDRPKLEKSIHDVIDSFSIDGRQIQQNDEILIQPYINNLSSCGVLLTRDPQHGSPYFVLNYDMESGRSDVVTSGSEGIINTYYLSREIKNEIELEKQHRLIFDVGHELIHLSHHDALDIEYAITANGQCYLFQVRPLACLKERANEKDEDVFAVLSHIHEFISEASLRRPGQLGSENLFGNMTDWNPAEMIGPCPKPLALSLYQTLIGDHAWAKARHNLGYKNLIGTPLILSMAGRPYVDIRTSLNSFLPSKLSEDVGEKWINACIKKLRSDPALHDKIEFDLAITCLTPEWNKQQNWLNKAGLSTEEINDLQHCYLELTSDIIQGKTEPIKNQYAAISKLSEQRNHLLSATSNSIPGLGRRLRQLVIDSTNLGLIPFSIMARYGFIAMSFLKGLRDVGAINDHIYENFLLSIPTISSQFARDMNCFVKGDITIDEMISTYGHLRPHSYDITSKNYAENSKVYFKSTDITPNHQGDNNSQDPAQILCAAKKDIQSELFKIGLDIEVEQLSNFMIEAIAGREQIKFEFMKNVNAILETITEIGNLIGLTKDELSFVPISEFMYLESNSISRNLDSHIRRVSGQNEKSFLLANNLRLPDLLRNANEVYAHQLENWRPNFVSRKKIIAKPVLIDNPKTIPNLENAIVFIRAADPGYDWIFTHKIGGLVTQYGGVASHMAIRAAEFGLPAAIGCGSALYEKLSKAEFVELDCLNNIIREASC